MQYLPKDSMRRLWKGKGADAVQITGCLQLPEHKNKRSLSDVSPERNEAQGSDTQDTQGRTLSRESLHAMWSIPGRVGFSEDEEKARRRMSYMRVGALRGMRYNVAPRKLCGFGYLPLLLTCRRQAHHMPGLHHENEQTESLHVSGALAAQ